MQFLDTFDGLSRFLHYGILQLKLNRTAIMFAKILKTVRLYSVNVQRVGRT